MGSVIEVAAFYENIFSELDSMTVQAINEEKQSLIELNREQMQAGKNSNGEYLPTYESDPFFKTIKGAKGYEAFKQKVSPNKSKPSSIMDFYINGKLQTTIDLSAAGRNYQFNSLSPIYPSANEKAKGLLLGLSGEYKERGIVIVTNNVLKQIKNKL